MNAATWAANHWFDLFQTVGIIGSLLTAAYTMWRDEKARRVGNSIAINEQYQNIQRELIRYPELNRVFEENVDLQKEPLSIGEEAFVKMVLGQLSTVYRAMTLWRWSAMSLMTVRRFWKVLGRVIFKTSSVRIGTILHQKMSKSSSSSIRQTRFQLSFPEASKSSRVFGAPAIGVPVSLNSFNPSVNRKGHSCPLLV